jgi:glycosyltransferase involved in cell wall biosynthesis
MRILVIAPTPFFADRGCHVRILGEAKALQRLGHLLKVCTYHLGRDIGGLETARTVTIPWYRKLSAGPSIHKFYIDLLLLWKVLQSCWRFKPDVLHAHLHEGIVIGKMASALCRIPMVADLQGSLTEELLDHRSIPKWGWLIRLVRWVEGTINRMPQHVIISSMQTARIVRERFGLEDARMTAIGDGVDLDLFFPRSPDEKSRASLGIGREDRVVVFIGVLTPYQGIDLLMEAVPRVLSRMPHAKFLVIGYPEQEYRQKAEEAGIGKAMIFTGMVPYAEAARLLSVGHIAVSPKMSATEANQKLFVYMAMGFPVVVFDNPVNREILGDLGVYAANGDVAAFADAVVALLADERRARELGRRGSEKAARDHSWQAVGDRLADLYRQVGNGKA